MAIYDANDNILMRFQYADSRLPVAMQSGGATYYLAYDQVGSLRIVTDASGNVIKTLDYDSFGNIIQDSNPGFDMPFGFAGSLYDPDTGLIRFGFREYSPEIGRWTAKDPILFMGGSADLYGYCLNDPINWIDTDGRLINLAAAGVGAVVGGVIGGISAGVSGDSVWKGAASGALVGGLGGLSFGASLLVNAAVGAGIGVGAEILEQKWNKPCPINWTSVAISGVAGAVGGGVGAGMLKGGASAADAALMGGALAGGVEIGLLGSAGPDDMVPYNP